MSDIKEQAIHAEEALIAHVLYNPKDYVILSDIVKPEYFLLTTHSWIWRAMSDLTERGMGIDVITVGDELDRDGHLAEFRKYGFTGRAALSTLKDIPVSGNGRDYAVTVQDYAAKRNLMNFAGQVANWASNGRKASDILADIEAKVGQFTLHSGKVNNHTVNTMTAGARAIDLMELAAGGERALETGLIDLDKYLYPQKTELITFAARPGKGKSSLLATITLNAARRGKRIKYFSLEMGHAQIAQRMISQLSDVSAFDIMRGRVCGADKEKVIDAANDLGRLPIVICDLPAISIGQIRNEARRSEIDVMVLDYVQLANADKKNENRNLDVGEVTRGLKALAIELDIPILIAAQLSRAAEVRAEKRPILSDLRESGSIEQDSDSVVFIYDKGDGSISPAVIDLLIEKHRNGPTGNVTVMFDQKTMKFYNSVML
jgi:replicative DNA helicase